MFVVEKLKTFWKMRTRNKRNNWRQRDGKPMLLLRKPGT